jgi:putative hemolysin
VSVHLSFPSPGAPLLAAGQLLSTGQATHSLTNADVWYIVISFVLIVLSGFLALSETALTRTSRIKAISLEEEGRRGATKLVRLVTHPETFLNSLLLLLMLCHFIAATLLGIVFDSVFGSWGILAAIVVDVVIVFVFAEAAPKTWAVLSPERAALDRKSVV